MTPTAITWSTIPASVPVLCGSCICSPIIMYSIAVAEVQCTVQYMYVSHKAKRNGYFQYQLCFDVVVHGLRAFDANLSIDPVTQKTHELK